MNDYLNDMRSIAENISITDEHTYAMGGKSYTIASQQVYQKWNQPLQSFGQNSGEESQLRSTLQTRLAAAVYSSFYCSGSAGNKTVTIENSSPALPTDRTETIKRLSEANTSQSRTDPYWTVYSLDNYGTAYVMKNGHLRYLLPNEWEFANPTETSLKTGSVVNLKIAREDTTVQPVFYHVRSTELVSQQAEFTRIYFNTNFEGAILLVKEITRIFNQYKVPFLFKCLNQPELFNRTDSAVLYFDKIDFRFGSNLLSRMLPGLQPFLKPEIPLFTYGLLPGVSFSEDPGNGQSFGMNRCNLVAEGLVNAFYKESNTAGKQFAEILKVFQKNGIDPDKIYLKPHSKFPYDFSIFTNTH